MNTDGQSGSVGDIILFPEYESLKKEVEKLRVELSILLLERDDLLLMECKNIEMAYMLEVGYLEYGLYELQCNVLRLKRKVELIQARMNRQEAVVVKEIETILNKEFAEYQKRLNDQMGKMNQAIERNRMGRLSEEETREIKKLYRKIVKVLHPDLHVDVSEAQRRLFGNAVQAYEDGDLTTLRIIYEVVQNSDTEYEGQDAIVQLVKEKIRLTELLAGVKEQIAKIKSEYPYTLKKILMDATKLEEYKAELELATKQYEELKCVYDRKIKDMLGESYG